jgi:NADPH-dependent 2,4-dienoyl-CoA reductase/sulfur reductase-like enzyme
MQAAKVAAQRGHTVTLYEASGELGGAWNIACAQPHKESYRALSDRLEKDLKEARVTIVLNTRVDASFVTGEKPDAVILATGAAPITPDVVGVHGPHVVQAVDVFRGKSDVGERTVIIGGRLVGMETADYLAEKGKKVSIITFRRLGENGRALEENIYRTLRDKLIRRGIQIFPYTAPVEIRPDGVFANDNGRIQWLPADTVVLAVGYEPVNTLHEELKGVVAEIYTAGDCNAPRDALDSTREGMEVGQAI